MFSEGFLRGFFHLQRSTSRSPSRAAVLAAAREFAAGLHNLLRHEIKGIGDQSFATEQRRRIANTLVVLASKGKGAN